MYLNPPTRDVVKFTKGQVTAPPQRGPVKPTDFHKFVSVYDEVTARAGRCCENCGKPYLAAPHLALAILDPTSNWFAAKNLRLLCPACNRSREAALGVTAEDVTGIVRETVFRRDASCCVYTDRPMAKNRRTLVPVVDSPDPTNPDDWACSSKEAAKERGPMSHKQYLQVCLDRTRSLFGYLMERVEDEE